MKYDKHEQPVAPTHPTPGSHQASARLARPILALAIATLTVSLTSPATFAADTIMEAFEQGKASLNIRPRYEFVDQTGLENANALTIATRLGFTTADLNGFSASLEANNTTAIDGNAYNQAGLNPGGAGKAVVADPTLTEINQVWLKYTGVGWAAKVGRQKLILDNARFIGNVGWRQNMQTFDAITLTSDGIDDLMLTYS